MTLTLCSPPPIYSLTVTSDTLLSHYRISLPVITDDLLNLLEPAEASHIPGETWYL